MLKCCLPAHDAVPCWVVLFVELLLDESCDARADITKRFEQDVAREMWGDARKR